MVVRIAVIGAGVVGLSTAVNAQRVFPDAKVTVIADKFDDETTSFGPAGILRMAPDPNKPNYDVMRKCAQDSWDFISQLSRTPSAQQAGVSSAYFTALYDKEDTSYGFVREVAHDFQSLSPEQIKKRGWNKKVGYSFTSYVVQTTYYLKWLMKQFQDRGGMTQVKKVHNLRQLSGDFDLVLNCCGLGARELVGDKRIEPVKGQMVYVKAPWIKNVFMADNITYVVPQMDRVALGVVRIPGRYDLTIDPALTKDILERTTKMVPELKGAEIIGAWAGLRPVRDEIRMEIEHVDCGAGRTLPVVHNYGHGAHGIALSWGTAVHAVSLARSALRSGTMSKL